MGKTWAIALNTPLIATRGQVYPQSKNEGRAIIIAYWVASKDLLAKTEIKRLIDAIKVKNTTLRIIIVIQLPRMGVLNKLCIIPKEIIQDAKPNKT